MELVEPEEPPKIEASEAIDSSEHTTTESVDNVAQAAEESLVNDSFTVNEPPIAIGTDSAKKRRRELSLSEKIQLIHESQTGTKSQRKLADIYQIGKTTVHEILKKKDDILKAYEQNVDGGRKRVCTRSAYSDINRLAWQWYERMRAQGNQISGPMLQEKARTFAAELDMKDFRASNGWLEGFRRRHGISFGASFSGYETSVNVTTEWTEKIMEVTDGYRSTDIYNLVETGLYYRALPDKNLVPETESTSTERLTVTLCCNMDGEFEKPLVIGPTANPPCFAKLDSECLPVIWRANRRAWITTSIFADWLRTLDRKMRQKDRRILLFLDNSPPHPPTLQLTNVKLVFLIKPSNNTVNQLQPLTQGIVEAFRMAYRRKVLFSTLAKLDDSNSPRSAKQLMQEITELDACFWIAATLDEISGSTMMNCFESAGFLVNTSADSSLSSYSMAFPPQAVSTSPQTSSTPAKAGKSKAKVKKQIKLPNTSTTFEEIMSSAAYRIMLTQPMTVKEYITFDAKLKVADDLSEGWEERLVEDYCDNKKNQVFLLSNTAGSEGTENIEIEAKIEPVIQTYPEALNINKQLMLFAVKENDGDLVKALYKVEAQMQRSHLKKLSSVNQKDVELNDLVTTKINMNTVTSSVDSSEAKGGDKVNGTLQQEAQALEIMNQFNQLTSQDQSQETIVELTTVIPESTTICALVPNNPE